MVAADRPGRRRTHPDTALQVPVATSAPPRRALAAVRHERRSLTPSLHGAQWVLAHITAGLGPTGSLRLGATQSVSVRLGGPCRHPEGSPGWAQARGEALLDAGGVAPPSVGAACLLLQCCSLLPCSAFRSHGNRRPGGLEFEPRRPRLGHVRPIRGPLPCTRREQGAAVARPSTFRVGTADSAKATCNQPAAHLRAG